MSSTGEPDGRASRSLGALLLALTFGTGVVDAISFLGLDRVFVANMTGNVVLLGFALAGAADLQVLGPLLALVGFLAGAFGGGFLAERLEARPRRWFAVALGGHAVLAATAAALALNGSGVVDGVSQQVVIVLLAVGMGVQTATARRIGIPELNTAVVTTTLTALAADWHPRSSRPATLRRALAVSALVLGAFVGAAVLLGAGLAAALLLVTGILAATAFGMVMVAGDRRAGRVVRS
jgi:uncharacterized membrane protein YoaK (UPF0700 family)